MESYQRKGKEKRKRTEEIHQHFKKLEQEWEAYKESKPKAPCRHSFLHSNQTIHKPSKYSPRELMFNLQQESPSPPLPWKNVTRIKDVSVREILQERREAIERGKLKGRRLFQSTTSEGESSDHVARSMSFWNSDIESDGSEGVHDYCTHDELSSLCSSSSSCLAGDNDNDDHNKEKLANFMPMIEEMRVTSVRVTQSNRRMNYAVFLGGVIVILLVISMCMCLTKNFGGDECHIILVPT
ncbi:hypothetical protein V8G54_005502 [Vigna mungo]|uniref:Uncharacterized protein n=1 Tax=Vigna mungo TaxID=3915 RepID=A0AAQ3NY11_VIGMU